MKIKRKVIRKIYYNSFWILFRISFLRIRITFSQSFSVIFLFWTFFNLLFKACSGVLLLGNILRANSARLIKGWLMSSIICSVFKSLFFNCNLLKNSPDFPENPKTNHNQKDYSYFRMAVSKITYEAGHYINYKTN